jgi:hypothetical protein
MARVVVTITAFDKNTSNFFGKTIVADSKEEFNEQVEEFETEIPFSRFYITMENQWLDDLTEEQLQIVEDHEVE